jgi:hypothetical protein
VPETIPILLEVLPEAITGAVLKRLVEDLVDPLLVVEIPCITVDVLHRNPLYPTNFLSLVMGV